MTSIYTQKWNYRFLELAMHVAQWSRDPSTKVGAVITDYDKRVVSIGYNGFPMGVNDDERRYEDRETKYRYVVHAEANAIISATQRLSDCVMSVTHPPCQECAKLIIQSGIGQVNYIEPDPQFAERFKESWSVSKTMFDEAGVEVNSFLLM